MDNLDNLIRVFNIQRFSIYDGQGIRTTAFLKGCTLKCKWCHNPESIEIYSQVQFLKYKCIGCNYCKKVCENINNDILLLFASYPNLPDNCAKCNKCFDACPTGALLKVDRDYTVDALYNELIKDKEFYINSNGGVTLSGGEPLLQAKKILPLVTMLKSDNINIAIETAGNISFEHFSLINDYVDTYLFDIKAINPITHKKGTGCDNSLILSNFNKLYDLNKNICVRIPIIPDFNDNTNSINEFIEFLSNYKKLTSIELMPYHNLGEHKYNTMDINYEYNNYPNYDLDKLEVIKAHFKQFNIDIV